MRKKQKTTGEKKTPFLTGVKVEFSRVTWPGRKEVGKRFPIVILISVIAALLIAGTDTLIQAGIELLLQAF